MRILSAVLCDEVRKEDTGKLIIIGVYQNEAIVPAFPAQIPLTLWVRLSAPKKESVKLEVRVRNKKTPRMFLLGGSGTLTVEEPNKDVFITFPKMDLSLEGPSVLIFEIKEEGGRWQKVIEIPVMQGS